MLLPSFVHDTLRLMIPFLLAFAGEVLLKTNRTMRGAVAKLTLVAAAAAFAVDSTSGERLLQEEAIATVGLGPPVLIGGASSIGSGSANVTFSTSSTTAEEELVEALEADSQVTGTRCQET